MYIVQFPPKEGKKAHFQEENSKEFSVVVHPLQKSTANWQGDTFPRQPPKVSAASSNLQ